MAKMNMSRVDDNFIVKTCLRRGNGQSAGNIGETIYAGELASFQRVVRLWESVGDGKWKKVSGGEFTNT